MQQMNVVQNTIYISKTAYSAHGNGFHRRTTLRLLREPVGQIFELTEGVCEFFDQKKKRADTCISRLGLVFVILPKLEDVWNDAVVPLSLTVSAVAGRPKFV